MLTPRELAWIQFFANNVGMYLGHPGNESRRKIGTDAVIAYCATLADKQLLIFEGRQQKWHSSRD